MGGWTVSELTRLRYLAILRDGSITSCKSENSLEYLEGSFSQVVRRRETDPWPKPLKMANIELKFFTCG